MNERFSKLLQACIVPADQVVDYSTSAGMVIPDEKLDVAKFAQLMVEEACQAFWSEACNVSDLAYEDYHRNSKKIRQHFGVE
jgi:hypothetical protein